MNRSLVQYFRWQAQACLDLGSPFYHTLCNGLAEHLRSPGPITAATKGFDRNPKDTALALRLLGTAHRMVLSGRAPQLARHYPSAGGDGDAQAAIDEFVEFVGNHVNEVREEMTRPPQTNEVGRSAPLFGALLHLSPDRPVRLFELGASGGVNLFGDQYRYLAEDGSSWGPGNAALVMDNAWDRLPGSAQPEIIERGGCDLDPLDVTTDEGALTLTSYVWPDQTDRLQRLRCAIGVIRSHGVDIEKKSISEFLAEIELVPDTLTVVWHSVMWQYVDPPEQAAAGNELRRLVDDSDETSPFAHISFEPHAPGGDQPMVFSVAYEDRTGLHRIGEAPAHGLPTRWYQRA